MLDSGAIGRRAQLHYKRMLTANQVHDNDTIVVLEVILIGPRVFGKGEQ